ncbi:MAG: hypothetical protein IPM53_29455 [Anaerolineaceae bacterium]|nr:hypothetical protein [Anaerolineaceae bacterium]
MIAWIHKEKAVVSPNDSTPIKQLTRLREGIIDTFNLEEVRLLVFDLGENYDDLRGETISAKIQALLEHLERKHRIPVLLNHLKQKRPDADWDSYLPAEPEAKSPYKGLQYFTENDVQLFFGREQLTALLVERLKKERFLVVVGASGSGKSSLVRAGLVPTIRRGVIEGNGHSSQDWPIHIITPTDQPLKTLAVSLTRDSESVTAATTLATDLQNDSHSLDLFLMRQLADEPNGRLLLVVDQFEELFTQCEDKEVRQQFIDNLAKAVQSGKECRLKLVLTLRADFYAFAVQYESLRPLLKTGQEIVGEMSEAELRQAIERPAKEEDWQFQAGLVEIILRDVGQEPGALPLLSHALQETWRRREGREMTLAGYQAAGGVRGAIAKTADAVYADLSAEQQTLARTIFLHLTELGEGTEDTRRRVWQTELVRRPEEQETVAALLQQLANARLITTDTLRGQGSEVREVVEVSHEALIREWPALRVWLDENREWLRFQRRLSRDAREWLAAKRDTSLLYRGGKLAQVREQTAEHKEELNQDEQNFIEAAIQEEEGRAAKREAQRQRELEAVQVLAEAKQNELEAQERRTTAVRRAVAGLSVLLVLALIATIFALIQRQSALDNEAEAIAQAKIARSQALVVSWQTVREQDPMEALLLAIAAGKTAETALAMDALNQQLPGMAKPIGNMTHAERVLDAIWNTAEDRILTNSSDGTAKVWGVGDQYRPMITLTHGEWVFGATWNRAEDRIFTSGSDGTVKVWDINHTDQPLFTLTHEALIQGAVWNGAEDRILTWSNDGTAKVWDVGDSDQPLFTMAHGGWVFGAAWNRTEDRILTWSQDGTAMIWDVNNPNQPLFILTHGSWVFGAAWNGAEDQILTWGCDDIDAPPDNASCVVGSAKLWDVDDPDEPLVILTHGGFVSGAVWNDAEDHILTWSGDGKAKVWDVADPDKPLFTLTHEDWVDGAAWNGAEDHILTWSGDGTAKVWDVADPDKPLFTLTHEDWVDGAAWNGAEDHILTWSDDGTAKVWDAADPDQPLFTLTHGGWVFGAGWNGAEDHILTWGCDVVNDSGSSCIVGSAKVWEVTDPYQHLLTLTHQNRVVGATWNEAEDRIFTWSDDGTARVWDVADSEQPLLKMEPGFRYSFPAWIGEENLIITVNLDDQIKFWDMADPEKPLFTLKSEQNFYGAALNEAKDRILTWSRDGRIYVWDVTDLEQPSSTLTLEGSVHGAVLNKAKDHILVWSRDGTAKLLGLENPNQPLFTLTHGTWIWGAVFDEAEDHVLTWSIDGTAKLWDVSNPDAPLFTLIHDEWVNGAAWNGAEDRILTWSGDGSAKVWNVADSDQPLFIMTHEDSVEGAAWNSTDDRILTWSNDGSVKVWDAATGERLFTLLGDGSGVTFARWNRDESRILLGTANGLVRANYTFTMELAELACQYTTRNFTWEEWQLYFPGQPYEPTCSQWPAHPTVPQGQ